MAPRKPRLACAATDRSSAERQDRMRNNIALGSRLKEPKLVPRGRDRGGL